MLGNGDGTFQTPAYYAAPVVSATGSAVTVDLNGDGYPDVAVISGQAIAVLLNQGSSTPGILASPKFYRRQTTLSRLPRLQLVTSMAMGNRT
jgi:hypothetical protein